MFIRLVFLLVCYEVFFVTGFVTVKDSRDCLYGFISDDFINRIKDCLPSNVFFVKRRTRCIFFKSFQFEICGVISDIDASFICYDPSILYECPEILASANPTPQTGNQTTTTTISTTNFTSSLSTVEVLTNASLTSLPPILFNMTNGTKDVTLTTDSILRLDESTLANKGVVLLNESFTTQSLQALRTNETTSTFNSLRSLFNNANLKGFDYKLSKRNESSVFEFSTITRDFLKLIFGFKVENLLV